MKDISYKLLHEDYEEGFFSLFLLRFLYLLRKKNPILCSGSCQGGGRWDWGCVDCSEITGLELCSITFSDKVLASLELLS